MVVINVIKYWLKVVQLDDTKYVKIDYKVMPSVIAIPSKSASWAKSVRNNRFQ